MTDVTFITAPDVSILTKVQGHKFDHGHVLVLTGGSGHTGAARLAARAALRIGAGLVTLGVPPAAQLEVATQITSLMLTRVQDARQLKDVLTDTRINTVCIGPGLGLARARDLVMALMAIERSLNIVLDADALTAFREDPDRLLTMLHARCVLTPHGGEFARLFPDISEAFLAQDLSKADATLQAARRAGCTVLFKGQDTVIADESGACGIHNATGTRAVPWLATAGAGDVLSGIIAGLMARGAKPFPAAQSATWLHSECARQFGPGLIAEDLPDQIPSVLARVLNDGSPSLT